MKTLILSGIWFVEIQVFVIIHYIVIEKFNRKPYHALSFCIAVVLALLLSINIYQDWTFGTVSIIYMGLMYWIIFPLELNLLRHKPPLYLGDSIIDRLEMRMKNPEGTLGLKVVLMIMCLFFLLDLPNPWAKN